MTRAGGSLRMQTRIAVEATIGSSPRTRVTAGVTVAIGSRQNRMMMRPMVAFQKPMTVHGSVTANMTMSAVSVAPRPPTESAAVRSQSKPIIVAATTAANTTRR